LIQKGESMEQNLLKELTVEQLKTLEKQVKQEIDRRSIKKVSRE